MLDYGIRQQRKQELLKRETIFQMLDEMY